MPVTVHCIECGSAKTVTPARSATYKFCGFPCRTSWRKKHWSGPNNPAWSGGDRTKTCQHCAREFSQNPSSTVATFRKQKFCSKACGDAGGIRYFGPENSKWTGSPRRKHRDSGHARWAKNVISRDLATCQRCGARETELQAHHIKPYHDHPELRLDVDNGLTVCAPCHWQIHSTESANGVNSGETAAGDAAGNPEPSFGRKPVEGATTRGRAYRRWDGQCDQCGTFLSRRWSTVRGKAHIFCSRMCSGKFRSADRQDQIASMAVTPPRAPRTRLLG